MTVLLTTAEAAAEVDVDPATIDTWKRRGYLAPAGKRGRWNLYRLTDVLTCEATRDRTRRKAVPTGTLITDGQNAVR